MKRFLLLFTVCLLAGCGSSRVATKTVVKPDPSCKVFLAGDSTCAPRKEKDRPKWGWGEKLAQYLDGYEVVNKAVGGRSSKSYIDEGRWDKLIAMVNKGDVVMIQFGHNDEKKKSPDRYTAPYGEFYGNLCRFISEVKAKEATPVILTSLSRRQFKDGVLKHTHGEYPAAAKKAAADNDVVLLDIEQLSYDWLSSLGEEQSASRFMFSVDGEDNTHFVELGATEAAAITAKALKECGNPYLSALVK